VLRAGSPGDESAVSAEKKKSDFSFPLSLFWPVPKRPVGKGGKHPAGPAFIPRDVTRAAATPVPCRDAPGGGEREPEPFHLPSPGEAASVSSHL